MRGFLRGCTRAGDVEALDDAEEEGTGTLVFSDAAQPTLMEAGSLFQLGDRKRSTQNSYG